MMLFNLLPYREWQRQRRRRRFHVLLALSVLLGCALAGSGWRAIVLQQQTQLARNRWLQSSGARLGEEIKHAAELQSRIEALNSGIGEIEVWRQRRERLTQWLTALPTQMPPTAYLQRMTGRGSEIVLDGYAASNRDVATLLQNLSAQTNDVDSARLLETRAENRQGKPSLAFSVAITLRRQR